MPERGDRSRRFESGLDFGFFFFSPKPVVFSSMFYGGEGGSLVNWDVQ